MFVSACIVKFSLEAVLKSPFAHHNLFSRIHMQTRQVSPILRETHAFHLTHTFPPAKILSRAFLYAKLRMKIIKIVATGCQILRPKCTKFHFGWGSVPDPAALPRPRSCAWVRACSSLSKKLTPPLSTLRASTTLFSRIFSFPTLACLHMGSEMTHV